MEDVTVTVLRHSFLDGQRQLAAFGRPAQTDDLGEYRLYDLTPGEYYIGASYRMNVRFAFGAGGVLTYRPLFYPGVPESSQASVLRLRPGEERRGVDLRMAPEPAFKVSGRILDGRTGEPVRRVTLSFQPEATAPVPLYSQAVRARSSNSGRFRAAGLPRGDYTIESVTQDDGGVRLYSAIRVLIVDSDIEDLELVLHPPVTISGVVKVENMSTLPAGLNEIHVVLTSGIASIRLATGGAGKVRSDGSFEISGVSAASYLLEVHGIPRNSTSRKPSTATPMRSRTASPFSRVYH